MPWGLANDGFHRKPRHVIVTDVADRVDASMGITLDRDPESAVMQLITALTEPVHAAWSAAEQVVQAGSTAASGRALDEVAAITGVRRLPATASSVSVVCIGSHGTRLEAGRIVSTGPGGPRFETSSAAVLDRPLQVWTATVHAARPGRSYTLDVDGQAVTVVASAVDTAASIASRLASDLATLASNVRIVSEGQTIRIITHRLDHTPSVVASAVPFTRVRVTLPRPLANTTYTVQAAGHHSSHSTGTIALPGTILADLVGQLHHPNLEVEDRGDGRGFEIASGQPGFQVQVSASLAVEPVTPAASTLFSAQFETHGAAVVSAVCDHAGPTMAPAGTLVRIETPVFGWNQVFNPAAADLGRHRESDESLHERRRAALQLGGFAVLPAIEARLLQEVPGCLGVHVVENDGDAPDADGRPPHSFEVVIDAPADADTQRRVAELILSTKPAGIRPVSAATQPVLVTLERAGGAVVVSFSRAEPMPLSITIMLHRHPEQPAPHDALESVNRAVLERVLALGIGEDFVWSHLLGVIHETPGVYDVQVTAAVLPAGAPTSQPIFSVGPRQRVTLDPAQLTVGWAP